MDTNQLFSVFWQCAYVDYDHTENCIYWACQNCVLKRCAWMSCCNSCTKKITLKKCNVVKMETGGYGCPFQCTPRQLHITIFIYANDPIQWRYRRKYKNIIDTHARYYFSTKTWWKIEWYTKHLTFTLHFVWILIVKQITTFLTLFVCKLLVNLLCPVWPNIKPVAIFAQVGPLCPRTVLYECN